MSHLLIELGNSGAQADSCPLQDVHRALTAFPELNSRIAPDRQGLVLLPQVHLGFAAQTDSWMTPGS
ncbi:2-oxo acid dehydrogenase subunit E2 [Streptomyces canus]|uniref:2-oxo acid dehydrogenase subunit E2 n=1 Tax=Streptomyces canus TaxID=58343 RepID=UPI0033B3F775